MSAAAFAAVDWGTSSFRLWLLDSGGAVLGERRSDEGMLSAGKDGFSMILERHLADLGAPAELPVIVCGMAGARQGWTEAPYVQIPARLQDIVAGAVDAPGTRRSVKILPGLAQRRSDAPDVMRGEETQLAGIQSMLGVGNHLVCMPGTHCKWVESNNGVIVGFRTWMTGELYSLLSRQSILRHSLGEDPQPVAPGNSAFTEACMKALEEGGDVSPGLFRIRAATLLQSLKDRDAAAQLSGLLIGAEIASARRIFDRAGNGIVLVESGGLGLLYAAALQLAGFDIKRMDAETAVRTGLIEAARAHGFAGARI